MSAAPKPAARKPARLCPICRRMLPAGPEAARFRPFCSRRCADVDLHRWLSGAYRVETDEAPGGTAGQDGESG